MSPSRKLAQLVSLLSAAALGVSLGACGPHSEYRVNKVCKRSCSRAVDCNDNIVYEDCVEDCVDAANDCDSEADVEAALDILDDCAGDSCNQLGTCSLEAWIECAL